MTASRVQAGDVVQDDHLLGYALMVNSLAVRRHIRRQQHAA